MVLGAPSPVQEHYASRVSTFKGGNSGFPASKPKSETSHLTSNGDGHLPKNGTVNPGFKGDQEDVDGIVPIDCIDTTGARAFFPWIEQAEDTPL